MTKTASSDDNLTPMFRQYFDLKERYPDSLLLFRCGDFYEMYGQDAVFGAKAMEISLTSREFSKGRRMEMAGVPYHALDNYLRTLVGKGIKVAVCEQLEDPKKTKGLVKRDVTRVITSGTVTDPSMLRPDENNYLLALSFYEDYTGIAVADISTGHFRVTGLQEKRLNRLKDELFRIRPSEVIVDSSFPAMDLLREYLAEMEIPLFETPAPNLPDCGELLKELALQEKNQSPPWDEIPHGALAAGILVNYLNQTQRTESHAVNRVEFYDLADYMVLDAVTWRNLELSHTMMERQKKGSLLWVIDDTKTGMGARLLRSWLERPLIDSGKINARLNAVGELARGYTLQQQLQEELKSIYDLERITTRVIYGSANGRDLLTLGSSLKPLPRIRELLEGGESSLLKLLYENLDPLSDICKLISDAVHPDSPITVRDGGVINDGYNLELDELREIRKNAREWIASLEMEEREATGIKSLKIKFNNVFGYFIEVTRSNLHLVPGNYIRKQTIAGGERFISPRLKEYESKILGAEEKIKELEYDLFNRLREKIAREAGRIQRSSRVVGHLDALVSLSSVAVKNGYCRPEITGDDILQIEEGRHPVVEKTIRDGFVANGVLLDEKESRFHIITGPNMSGKSTYLRQVGLICIMAQMGSFVPAKSARIGITDRVFTRVGASDDLHLGKSTFLVEMSETANIISNASRRSLILLDEIGRGTSTFDGLAIAWAVSEYIHDIINARTLFATHFHQLTELEERLPGVKNFRVDVKENNRQVIFLHRIVPGGTDKSYGIYVAQLAGLPPRILSRARDVLDHLESTHKKPRSRSKGEESSYQLTFYDMFKAPFMDEISRINPDELSPRDALDKIYQWKRSLD